MTRTFLLFTLLLCAVPLLAAQLQEAPAPLPPDPRFKSDILLIVAHPDDETAIGSWLARAVYDLHKRVAILYLNRGEGGGNSFGNEQSSAMGAIREIEVRRAAAAFGIDLLWFLDGQDTPGQDLMHSLTNWGHGENLERIVRLIRLTRPEVIITWLPHYGAGENHGDHQASGLLAVEAFDMAGDPTRFPAQIVPPRERADINNFTEGLQPWQPKKLYFFSDVSHPLPSTGPAFNAHEISPSQKVPYYELAARLHLPHLTQGDVAETALAAQESGDYSAFAEWISGFKLIFGKAVVPCAPSGDLFEGIKEGPLPFVQVRGYQPHPNAGIALELGGLFAFYRDFWRAHEIEAIEILLKPEVMINAGGYLHIPLLLINNTSESVQVELRAQIPEGWRNVAGEALYTLPAGAVRPVQTFFFAPERTNPSGETILWNAKVGERTAGSVSMQVFLAEWTLPQ